MPSRTRNNRRRGKPPKAPLRKLKGTVEKNWKGFGFISVNRKEVPDIFVPPDRAAELFHGDRVEFQADHRGNLRHVRVLEHRFREIVGRFYYTPSGKSRSGIVVYERKRAREEVFIPKVQGQVQPMDWVRVSLNFEENYGVTGQIVEVYGQTLPASADLTMVAAEYGLVEEHSERARKEAQQWTHIDADDAIRKGRTDLRNVPFITIDGKNARDFDDAVYVERNKSGYILWVAIADVSFYVKEGSSLDQDARKRGTSVYFPERAFHMLPRDLSENLCSLRPKEPRFSLVAQMTLDRQGSLLQTELIEAVIESKRRATYEEIWEEWEANQSNPNWEYSAHFELYKVLRKKRSARGSIDFELPEAEVTVDAQGEVQSILNRPRKDSHRLIEEFMIAANEAVTEWMLERRWPFVYRTHDEPSGEALKKFQDLAATVGIKVSFEKDSSPKVMADLVRRLEGHPAQALLNMALLRSMKQAIYSSTHGIHYGLASRAYTHFTSPIRRYPDLVVHRLLRMALREEKLGRNVREKMEEELAEICEHCSFRERLAADAERESIQLKQVRAMMGRLGEEFSGKIVGIIESGLFVQIPDPYVEGLISVDTMTDDFYQYVEKQMILLGRRKKKSFRIGDEVRVKLVRADIDQRKIDFIMVK